MSHFKVYVKSFFLCDGQGTVRQAVLYMDKSCFVLSPSLFVMCVSSYTVKTLNIGTPRPVTVVVLNIKQFNFTRK